MVSLSSGGVHVRLMELGVIASPWRLRGWRGTENKVAHEQKIVDIYVSFQIYSSEKSRENFDKSLLKKEY